MKKMYVKGYVEVNGLENSRFRHLEGLEESMEYELVRAYDLYSDVANKIIPDMNKAYDEQLRTEDEKDHVNEVRYNRFVAAYFTDHILAEYRFDLISKLLDFYVDEIDDTLTGYLKMDPNVTVRLSFSID